MMLRVRSPFSDGTQRASIRVAAVLVWVDVHVYTRQMRSGVFVVMVVLCAGIDRINGVARFSILRC
jgi:hypothetical protein